MKSSLDVLKSARNEINFFRITIKIDYEIFPKLLANLKYLNSVHQKNKPLKGTFVFHTNFNIHGIIIPGKITFSNFHIELKHIISNNKINLNSKSCSLKGNIKTGLVVLNGKIINNINNGFTREHTSCSLDIEWHGKMTIEIQFSFMFKFELDKNENQSLDKPFRERIQKGKPHSSTEFWLSCN